MAYSFSYTVIWSELGIWNTVINAATIFNGRLLTKLPLWYCVNIGDIPVSNNLAGRMYTHSRTHMHTRTNTHLHKVMFKVCVSVYTYMYIYIYALTRASLYVHIHVCTYTYDTNTTRIKIRLVNFLALNSWRTWIVRTWMWKILHQIPAAGSISISEVDLQD